MLHFGKISSFKQKSTDIYLVTIADLESESYILDRIQIPQSLSEIGVPESCAARIAEKAMQDLAYATNPRLATFEEVHKLVLASIKKAR